MRVVRASRSVIVDVFEDRPETARGLMLHKALLATHALIRRDLTFVEQLATAVLDGLPAEGLHEDLGTLKASSNLWQFQVSCLRYCGFVHMHHHAEDVEFFDELEQTNPAIGPVVERLRADHRVVSAFRLLADPGRLRLVAALLEDRELPVRELSRAASLSETATSQQLRVLREAGVVRRRRVGRQILYRLNGGDARALARTGIARASFRSSYSTRKDAAVTYIIAEPCIDIKDKSCVDVCPVDCIHEFDRMLVIDPEECIDCGACEPECPVEAIFPEDALPDKWEPFVKINYAYRDATDGDTADVINRLVDDYAREHNVKNEPIK